MKMLHILLAEDNRGDVFLVRRALEEHSISHQLHVAHDGAEAVTFIADMGKPGGLPCPDIVLLDLNLPIVDGPQVLAELRNDPECLHARVICGDLL